MLRLRRDQMKALGGNSMARFRAEIGEAARAHLGSLVAGLSEEGLEEKLAAILARGEAHGLETERDLYRYTFVALTFGLGFEEDPSLPWAARALEGEGDATERMDRLFLAALENEHLGLPRD